MNLSVSLWPEAAAQVLNWRTTATDPKATFRIVRSQLRLARYSRVLMAVTVASITGCQTPYVVKKPDFGDTEYAKYHERHCRKDVAEVCVETDVAIDASTIRYLVGRAKPYHTRGLEIVAVRVDRHLSDLNKLPTIEVVSGSYSWTDSGLAWDAVEQVTIFVWNEPDWSLKETVEMLYDPV